MPLPAPQVPRDANMAAGAARAMAGPVLSAVGDGVVKGFKAVENVSTKLAEAMAKALAGSVSAVKAVAVPAAASPGSNLSPAKSATGASSGLADLQRASLQLAGQFRGPLLGGMEAVGGASKALNSAMSGSLLGTIGGVSLGFAGLAVGLTASVAVAKQFAAAAAPDGLQSFNQAIDILVGTIGIAVVPFFVMLGATALGLAQDLMEWLDNGGMAAVTKWYVDALPNFIAFGDAMVNATKATVAFFIEAERLRNKAVGQLSNDIAGAGEGLGLLPEGTRQALTVKPGDKDQRFNPLTPDHWRNHPRKGGGSAAADAQGGGDDEWEIVQAEQSKQSKFSENFDKILNSMKQSFAGGKSGYSDVMSARDAIQQQNLQTDLQRELLEVQRKALAATEGVGDAIRNQNPVVGR